MTRIFNYLLLQKALERGIKTVRVRVKGLGPGRMVLCDNAVQCF